jgi:Uma2 family endonuclease
MSASTSQSDPPLFPAITFCDQEGALSFSVPASASSLDGFRQWALSDDFPERGKITFVAGGLIIDMSPDSLEEHSDIKSEICRVLLNLVRQQNLGRLHIDGVLVSNEAARVSNEPDILYLSKASLTSGRAKLTPAIGRPQSSKEIVGSVDWVLEIVSPTSMRKDKVLLREAYYQAGIDEYWIIDGLGQEI